MDLTQIKADLLRKLHIQEPTDAPDYMLDDVLNAINAAGQLLNAAGYPFWEKSQVPLVVTEATKTQAIDARAVVQVTFENGISLFRASSLQQLIQYGAVFADDEADASLDQVARVFHVDVSGTASDGKVAITVGPSPLLDQTLSTFANYPSLNPTI